MTASYPQPLSGDGGGRKSRMKEENHEEPWLVTPCSAANELEPTPVVQAFESQVQAAT